MRRRIRTAVASCAFVGFALLLLPSTTYACSCAGPSTPQDALRQADAVFSGKVLSTNLIPLLESSSTVVAVGTTWKGLSQPQIVVNTGSNWPGSCGYGFVWGG